MGTLYDEGESAGPAAQVQDSVPILKARLPGQRILECSLTRNSTDNGVVEARQPPDIPVPECKSSTMVSCVAHTTLGNTGVKRAILGFLALLPGPSAADFPSPLREPVCSLYWDARRITGGGVFTTSFSGHS
jgi:hypothetical protein